MIEIEKARVQFVEHTCEQIKEEEEEEELIVQELPEVKEDRGREGGRSI